MNKAIIILLHGLGHPLGNMTRLETFLSAEGYDTLNISYPSLKHDIDTLSSWLETKLSEENIWNDYPHVHFVTLSMGGLVVRRYLKNNTVKIPKDKMGKVVMLAPPNKGSSLADLCHRWWLYKTILGPAAQELITTEHDPNTEDIWYDLGIVAGTRRWSTLFGGIFLKGNHDGLVTVQSTKLKGMKDHISLPASHLFIGWKVSVKKQILHFLNSGQFKHHRD